MNLIIEFLIKNKNLGNLVTKFLVFFSLVFTIVNIRDIRRLYIDFTISQTRKIKIIDLEYREIIIGNSLIYPDCFFNNSLVKKFSFPGETIEGIREWIKTNDLSNVKKIQIWVGLNNILNGYSQEALEFEIQKLLVDLSKYNLQVVFWSVPYITIAEDGLFVKKKKSNNSITAFNHYLANIANEHNYKYVEVNRIIGESSIYRQPDGVHLNCTAFKKLKEKYLVSE